MQEKPTKERNKVKPNSSGQDCPKPHSPRSGGPRENFEGKKD